MAGTARGRGCPSAAAVPLGRRVQGQDGPGGPQHHGRRVQLRRGGVCAVLPVGARAEGTAPAVIVQTSPGGGRGVRGPAVRGADGGGGRSAEAGEPRPFNGAAPAGGGGVAFTDV